MPVDVRFGARNNSSAGTEQCQLLFGVCGHHSSWVALELFIVIAIQFFSGTDGFCAVCATLILLIRFRIASQATKREQRREGRSPTED
jgi:hypothetical protein